MKKLIFLLCFLVSIVLISCSTFKRSKPEIKEIELPKSCIGVTELITKKWKKHKELDYYYKDKDFLDKLVNEYKDCFIDLPVEASIKLLGNTPVKTDPISVWGKHTYLYFLDPECIEHPLYDCEMLAFRIKDGIIKEIGVGAFDLIQGQ